VDRGRGTTQVMPKGRAVEEVKFGVEGSKRLLLIRGKRGTHATRRGEKDTKREEGGSQGGFKG